MQSKLKNVVEALLFAAEAPMSAEALAKVVEVYTKEQIEDAIEELALEYDFLGHAFTLKQVAGGWCFRTRPELAGWLRRLRREQVTRLSQAALESLAVVAYKQPVLKAEVDRMRGVDTGGVLRALMEKGLVRVLGRQDLPGQPLIYGTTKRFLEVFDLKNLDDLPTLKEMEALVNELERIEEAKAGAQRTLDLGEAGEAAYYEPEDIEESDGEESEAGPEEWEETEAEGVETAEVAGNEGPGEPEEGEPEEDPDEPEDREPEAGAPPETPQPAEQNEPEAPPAEPEAEPAEQSSESESEPAPAPGRETLDQTDRE